MKIIPSTGIPMRFWLSLVLIMFLSSCAYVYQVQVGDIDDRESFESSPLRSRSVKKDSILKRQEKLQKL